MSQEIRLDEAIEPERYELFEKPPYRFEVDRRDFLRIFGTGIFVVTVLDAAAAAQRPQSTQGESGGRRGGGRQALPKEIGAWLRVGDDGRVTVFTGKVEVGQDIRTSLSQIVSEELTVPVGLITMVMGDTDLTPYDAGTFGSQTTPQMGPQLRRVASSAREVLIDQAAEEWKIDRSSLTASDGKIINSETKKSITFAELAKGQKVVKMIADNAPTTPASKWKIAGTSVPKVDGRDFVTGKHQYTTDLKRPGMLYGKIVRPSAFNATLVSADTSKAKVMGGVTVVQDKNFIGVTAARLDLAAKAAELITAEWTVPPQPSSKEVYDYLRKKAQQGNPAVNTGSISDGLAAADQKGRGDIQHSLYRPLSAETAPQLPNGMKMES